MKILAIDPGTIESGWVKYDTNKKEIFGHAKECNSNILSVIRGTSADVLAIEMVKCYGMPMGDTTIDTVVWIGRFIQVASGKMKIVRIPRKTVCGHICNSAKAKDSHIRQALIDRFGGTKEKAIGVKSSPGPLYKMCEDARSALAVAITYAEMEVK